MECLPLPLPITRPIAPIPDSVNTTTTRGLDVRGISLLFPINRSIKNRMSPFFGSAWFQPRSPQHRLTRLRVNRLVVENGTSFRFGHRSHQNQAALLLSFSAGINAQVVATARGDKSVPAPAGSIHHGRPQDRSLADSIPVPQQDHKVDFRKKVRAWIVVTPRPRPSSPAAPG